MKKTVAILVFILISAIGFAQSNLNVRNFEKFKTNYNSNAYESIFDQFSNEMQMALPLAKTKQFFSGLQSKAGKITDFEIIEVNSENTTVYKTTFEQGYFAIQFSIDAENKIAGFKVNPFVAKSTSTVENKLTQYPAAIANLIFENTKDFPENTQLSVAVLKNGKVSYYGVHTVDHKLIPIENQESVFEIGSLTKVFTSTVLANLVVEGKLKLTDKINAYYPFLFKNKTTITFESLANHTSGLPRLPPNLDLSNAENPYKNYGVKELDTYLAHQMILAKAENNTYDYSNLGAGLLGHTLGISQNKPFTKLVQDVFKKYQMSNSFINSENLGNALVKGLDDKGNVVYNWDFDVLFGGGGILSTTSDLVRFAEAQFNATNKALELTRKETAVVSDDMKIGLGWHLLKSEKGNDLIWHNGGTGGYSSSMVLDVKNKNGVIILSNVSGLSTQNGKIDALGFGVLKWLEK